VSYRFFSLKNKEFKWTDISYQILIFVMIYIIPIEIKVQM